MKIDYLANREEAVLDSECFPNYWNIGFKQLSTGKKVVLEKYDGKELDIKRLAKILFNHRVYTYNGLNYDVPMIILAMSGASNATLKKANDLIIPERDSGIDGLKPWEFMDEFNLKYPDFLDHIDLMPMAPSAAQKFSLKKYAGTMHSHTMRDLPYTPDQWLQSNEIVEVRSYLGNDLNVTHDLREEVRLALNLRAEISAEYNLDFRSKSDAQCGEAIMKLLVERETGRKIYKPKIAPGAFKYVAPDYIKFETPAMQQMLERLLREDFRVRGDGYVTLPAMFSEKKTRDLDDDNDEYEGGAEIHIGDGVYKMGIGGLHSNHDVKVSYVEDDDTEIQDNDVTSYYPWLIIRSGQEPDNMRGYFTKIFTKLVLERVAAKTKAGIAKRNGDKEQEKFWKQRAEGLKIFINGLFGKTGSPWSVVYAPKMMIQTTVTGQLSILMLIEQFHLHGWKVISANTDGFVTLVPKKDRGIYRSVIFDWEMRSGLDTEETPYKSYHARDVNNYVAFEKLRDKDGNFNGEVKAKRKGAYALSGRGQPAAMGLKKTPHMEISADAAVEFLKDGSRIEGTVRNCQDIRKFVSVRQVAGGGQKDGVFIGKVVRYFYSDDSPGPILTMNKGHRVSNSEGAEGLMTLPEELPRNIDYEKYEREAYAILHDMGMDVTDPMFAGRKGYMLAYREKQKTVHQVDLHSTIALCGVARKEFRDVWFEVDEVPSGMRHCAACKRADTL